MVPFRVTGTDWPRFSSASHLGRGMMNDPEYETVALSNRTVMA